MTDHEPDAPRPSGAAESTVALDAKGLRALTHPVRGQLLGLLRRHGPATATQLADRLGLNSGATSYHLRQLAAAGLIEDDAERGNARERWWRSVYQRQSFQGGELLRQDPEIAVGYLQAVATAYASRVQQSLNAFETMPEPWREQLDLSDWPLLLTRDEAAELRRELGALLGRYRRADTEAAADAPAGAERVLAITQLLPEPGETPGEWA
jgi:DNA-binding transcriptional ArsR family regulator